MTTIGRIAAGAAFSVLLSPFASAQIPAKPVEAKPVVEVPAPQPAPVFVVAKLGDKLEVLSKDALEAKNKQLAEEFTKAKQAYDKAKAAAEASHKKFEGKEPEKMLAEATGGEFASKAAADAALAKMLAKDKAGDKPKTEGKPKDDGKTGGKTPAHR